MEGFVRDIMRSGTHIICQYAALQLFCVAVLRDDYVRDTTALVPELVRSDINVQSPYLDYHVTPQSNTACM